MVNEEKRIIEIDGIKLEVDLRTAKRIDTFRVGDAVKILDTGDSYNPNKIYPGVIVGFCEFERSPTIEIMIIKEEYSGVDFSFLTITGKEIGNGETRNSRYEMIPYTSQESLFTQSNIVTKFDRQIEKKELELLELKRKKKYFIDDFQKAFESILSKEN